MSEGYRSPGWSHVSRRDFVLVGGAGGAGILLGMWYGRRKERYLKSVPERPGVLSPSVFLAVEPDGSVVVWVTKAELGQGVWTVLPMVVAEELDADWALVRPVQALVSRTYGSQMTAVSSSLRSLQHELRVAGATAREMLVAAAAAAFGVPVAELSTAAGFVEHRASGRRQAYGPLVASAARLPVPSAPRLKRPEEFRLIGTPVPRLDLEAKISGAAVFGLDVRRPGQRFAAVARAPRLGAVLEHWDDTRARAVPGVERVVPIARGIAVVARDTWSAMRGREALVLRWSEGPHAAVSTASIGAALEAAAQMPGAEVRRDGIGVAGLQGPGERVAASYSLPFLAHATMEPINATVAVADGRCEIWAPTQNPAGAQAAACRILGLAEPDVIVHSTFVGGGFGRRVAEVEVIEAIEIARQVPFPVQVVWAREDDLRHDFYRPCALHRLEARLDAGRIAAWHHRVVCPSIAPPGPIGPDYEGAETMPYAIADVAVEWGGIDQPLPLGFWRSVGHSHTAFAVECFVDELAERLRRDPVDLRRELLASQPRLLAVVEAAAAMAAAHPVAADAARGFACHASFGSFVATMAEVVLRGDEPVVERIWCAVDCGAVVHPDIVRSQIEGGVVFGLSAALLQRIDVEGGAVTAANFTTFPLLRLGQCPKIEVSSLTSVADAGGVGEIAVPPVAPAVANAVSRLRRERVRQLPLS